MSLGLARSQLQRLQASLGSTDQQGVPSKSQLAANAAAAAKKKRVAKKKAKKLAKSGREAAADITSTSVESLRRRQAAADPYEANLAMIKRTTQRAQQMKSIMNRALKSSKIDKAPKGGEDSDDDF